MSAYVKLGRRSARTLADVLARVAALQDWRRTVAEVSRCVARGTVEMAAAGDLQ